MPKSTAFRLFAFKPFKHLSILQELQWQDESLLEWLSDCSESEYRGAADADWNLTTELMFKIAPNIKNNSNSGHSEAENF